MKHNLYLLISFSKLHYTKNTNDSSAYWYENLKGLSPRERCVAQVVTHWVMTVAHGFFPFLNVDAFVTVGAISVNSTLPFSWRRRNHDRGNTTNSNRKSPMQTDAKLLNVVGPNMLRPFAWNHNNVGTCWHLLRIVWNRSNFWRNKSQHFYCYVTGEA